MSTGKAKRANRLVLRRDLTPSPTCSGDFKDGKGKTNISYSLALAQRPVARGIVLIETELLEMAL